MHLCFQQVGEPPLFLAASVFFAIKDAVAAARADQGLSGPFTLNSPATSERIRMAVGDRFARSFVQADASSVASSAAAYDFVAKGSV